MSARRRAARRALPAVLLTLLLGAPAAAEEPAPWEAPLHHVFPTHRGRLGLEIQPMTPELREHLGAPADRGLLVVRVAPGSPAEHAGVRVGDVVTAAAGEPMAAPFDLVRRVGRVEEGETLELALVRDGEKKTLEVSPAGEATPWVDPEQWSAWLERGMREGSAQLRQRIDELERRLEELEERLRERDEGTEGRAT